MCLGDTVVVVDVVVADVVVADVVVASLSLAYTQLRRFGGLFSLVICLAY